jgi:predicted  nucleic acid-binding Zn-ribbon protein
MSAAAALLKLQELDLDISRSEKRLDELPEKRAILDVRAKQREVAALKAKADILVSKLESELKRLQDETAALDEKIAGEQRKIMSGQINDHKQVQNISRELDSLRRRKDKLEMETLQVMERIEKANAQGVKVDEAIAKLAERDVAYVERFKERGGELQSRIAEETRRRGDLAGKLEPGLLTQYECLRTAKSGIAVGRLEGGESCSACRMSLPTGAVAALQAGPDVGICPQCHRLIIIRGGDESGRAASE